MEKKIKHTLKTLQIEYAFLWVLSILTIICFETDLFPQGLFADNYQITYFIQFTGILLMLLLIPVAFRLFNFSFLHKIRKMHLPQALNHYKKWSEIRFFLFLIPLLLNLFAYYLTLNTTTLLCVGIILIASLFCIPSYKRINKELYLQDH